MAAPCSCWVQLAGFLTLWSTPGCRRPMTANGARDGLPLRHSPVQSHHFADHLTAATRPALRAKGRPLRTAPAPGPIPAHIETPMSSPRSTLPVSIAAECPPGRCQNCRTTRRHDDRRPRAAGASSEALHIRWENILFALPLRRRVRRPLLPSRRHRRFDTSSRSLRCWTGRQIPATYREIEALGPMP